MVNEAALKTVTISGGVTLRYQGAVVGKPLVMLPSWSQSAAEFKYQMNALTEGRPVIALNKHGHGESHKLAGGCRHRQSELASGRTRGT